MIFQTPEDRQFYESRIKYLHNEEARLIAAREEARKEGREEGREEGTAHGRLIGKVQTLQEIVGDSTSSTSDLLQLSLSDLSTLAAQLQDRLRSRGA